MIGGQYLTMWQLHNGIDRVSRLRGAAAYELVRTWGADVYIGAGGEQHVRIAPGRWWVQVVNPVYPEVIDQLAEWQADGASIVVDVTFPLDQEGGNITGTLPEDDPLKQLDDEFSRSYWTDPTHVGQLKRAIRQADAVITPHQEWASPLYALNPRVVVVGDITDEASPLIPQPDVFLMGLYRAHTGNITSYWVDKGMGAR